MLGTCCHGNTVSLIIQGELADVPKHTLKEQQKSEKSHKKDFHVLQEDQLNSLGELYSCLWTKREENLRESGSAVNW